MDAIYEKLNAKADKKLKLQEMIVDMYNVRPSVAYLLTVIIERFAQTANDEYERGKYDATN